MRVHLVGVAASNLSRLAALLVELGHEVSGSDTSTGPPIGPELEVRGVRLLKGYDARHLDSEPDLVVIGAACQADNVEALAAIRRGLFVTHASGALAHCVLNRSYALVAAGTAGKTMTAAMMAWLLEAAGFRPGFLIGDVPKNFERSWRAPRTLQRLPIGDGPVRKAPFVVEADDHEAPFFEHLPAFAALTPQVLVLTEVDYESLDAGAEPYAQALTRLVASVPAHGLLVANASDPEVVRLVARARAKVAWFGLQDDDNHGLPVHWLGAVSALDAKATSLDLYAGGVLAGRLALGLHGRHNLRWLLGALAAVVQGFGIKLAQTMPAVAQFAGVEHREQLIGNPGGVHVYADSRRHARGVGDTLLAVRLRHPQSRLIAIFEPRPLTGVPVLALAQSLSAADHVLVADLRASAGDGSFAGEALVAALRERGVPAETCRGVDATSERAARLASRSDALAILCAAAFGGIHDRLLEALSASS